MYTMFQSAFVVIYAQFFINGMLSSSLFCSRQLSSVFYFLTATNQGCLNLECLLCCEP